MKAKKLLGLLVIIIVSGFIYKQVGLVSFKPANRATSIEKLFIFGDASRSKESSSSGASYGDHLSKILGVDVSLDEVDRSTSEQALEKLSDLLLPDGTNLVIITLGLEDLVQHLGMNQTYKNLEGIFTAFLGKGVMVAYMPVTMPSTGDNWVMGLEHLCRQYGVIFVPDLRPAMNRETPATRVEDYDQELVAKHVLKSLQPYL